jgi:hypothetical protein
LGDQFEVLEQNMLGDDGFGNALGRISKIEVAFGLTDLATVTPPSPPSAKRNSQGLNPGVGPSNRQVALPAAARI